MIRQPHCFHGVVARTTAPFRFTKNMAPTFYIGAKIIDNKQQIRTPFRLRKCSDYGVLVRVTGLEPALLSEAAPKTAVYANFTTPAYYSILIFGYIGIIRKSTTVVTLPKADVYAQLATASMSAHTRIYFFALYASIESEKMHTKH